MECGANTISEERTQDLKKHQGVFSVPFFTTGAKFIIRNDKRHFLNETTPSFKIGVLGETTTEHVVNSIYPTAKLVPVIDRADAINKLESGYIDAYISDEILLPSILKELETNSKDSYSIEPKAYGFTNESYGVVVYDDKLLLDRVNNWIIDEGQEAKKSELEKQANYNWISERLKFLLSQDYFYNLVGFLLIFLPLLFFLLLVTHPLFIALVAKLPLFARFLKWIRRRPQGGKRSFVAPLIRWILDDETFNVVTYKANKSLVPMYIDRETVVALVKEVGQPLVYLNNESEPSTVEVEKVAQNLAQEAEKNPHFAKVLETVKDAATEETEKWIRSAVTRAFELLKQAVDPGGSSS
ncbi:transporter substrate-binding domain-containing protein [Nostoc sp. GT001]|uniref:transporter substrate-binding domain-containing protein n=1 Tax=Nostoc sp. GT001 TaxID=3056647 RepID=UPI0025AAFBED|nr:transporter substrate-binding domain-containing protein [Nostoc sp. GT001]MDM9585118.1 transporter substrate-binding domain-containing protein [Nostoc sp. GT001]